MLMPMLTILYLLVLAYTVARILLDTNSTPKTLAYLLLVFMIPGVGILVYFSLGINYRHQRLNSKAAGAQGEMDTFYSANVLNETELLTQEGKDEIAHFLPMTHFLQGLSNAYLFKSDFKLLVNGEEKFPEVLKSLEQAQHFIHLEYYAWENDIRGNQIKDILLKKAQEGVKVRALYDDYASRKIRHNIVKELQEGGVEIHPKIKVKLKQFANRLNHRDHRKIIIIDGKCSFVGGINLSDRYDNSIDTGLFWRDTHVKIFGPLTNSLQRHFIVSWNSSGAEPIQFSKELFPQEIVKMNDSTSALGQVVPGGPIYQKSNIMLSYVKIFSLATEKLYVTNPYFIPNETIMNALCQAAISGVDVRLMIPEKPDSAIVGAASKFYFTELLNAGVRIFLYRKGFVHAKTVVADSRVSVVGTANMDIRSFDLNFEIMSIIYGTEFASKMEDMFQADLAECSEVSNVEWQKKKTGQRLIYAIARLISSFL
jgi:cardiolipin synthase